MEENSLNNHRKEKKRKLNNLTEQYFDSNATTSVDSSFTKIKKKRKREKDRSLEREVAVKIEVDNDNNSTISTVPHKYLEIESLSDVDGRKRKKIKTESSIKNNDEFNNNDECDKYEKKKKKKHKEVETSESTLNEDFNDVEAISGNKNKIKVESQVETDCGMKGYENKNSYVNCEPDTVSIKNKKKKKKKEKTHESNEHLNGNVVDVEVENQLQYTNSQLSNIDYSTDNVDTNTKKKKKKKHKDIKAENAFSDEPSKLITEGEVKVKVKSEVTDSDTKVKIETNQESSINSSNELHVKKSKKKHKHSESDKVNDHLNDSSIKIEKIKKEEIEDESNINVEDCKKNKKNKHKKDMKAEAVEVESMTEEKNSIQESNDLESSQKVNNKKKKHKKHNDSPELDVVKEEMDIKNIELIEPQQKKKKRKKHSKELLQEESEPAHIELNHVVFDQNKVNKGHSNSYDSKTKNSEKSGPVHLDLDYVVSNQENIKEDDFDSHSYKKKKKKSKRQKEATDIEEEANCDSPKTRYKKMEMILQEESTIKDKTDKEPEESSGFESDEGDYSESERIPRMSKIKPSIFTKYPKLARIMQDSDSDENYPHLQYRKLTLSEALKLSELQIQLRHEPPPQHQIEKYPGTCTLTSEEKKKFMKYCKLKSGRFDYDEDQRIVHNWKKFCKTHGWKRSMIYPFLHQTKKGFFYVASVDGRKKFVQFLAKGLPNRSLYSVYTRFRNLYATHKTKRYTKEEDEVIMNELKDHNGRNRFSVIGRKLNRTRASVWRRYKLLLAKRKENSDDDNDKQQNNKTNEPIAE